MTKIRHIFEVVFLLSLTVSVSAANARSMSVQFSDSVLAIQQTELDSLRARVRFLENRETQEYVSTLEKTNQQLSLWFNPYGILVGSLAVLFALLAIVATVVIYRQTRDYKEKLDTFVKSYQDVFEKLIKEWKSKRDDLDKQIQDYQTQLETTKGAQKKTVEDAIEKLKAQKDSVSSQIASTVAAMPSSGGLASVLGMADKYHKCSQCGFGFMVTTPNSPLHGVYFGTSRVACPKCGNIDELFL